MKHIYDGLIILFKLQIQCLHNPKQYFNIEELIFCWATILSRHEVIFI